MCEKCWNADSEKPKECSFSEKNPFVITFEQLKREIIEKWIATGDRNFRVNKKTIFNPPKQSYAWEATQLDDNGNPLKKECLSIQFL